MARSVRHLALLALILSLPILGGCPAPDSPNIAPPFGVKTIAAVSPANGATGVATSSVLTVNFTRPPDQASLSPATTTIAPATLGDWTVDGLIATFTPSAPLLAGTTYSVTLSKAVRDQAGDHLSAAYSWSFTTAAGADTTPPGAVGDLATTAVTPTSVALKWTAPSDNAGAVSSYELRYATGAGCPLLAATFATATRVTTSAPKAAGGAESITVTGLSQKTSYCFAIRSTDAAGNNSDLSNQVTATTGDGIAPASPSIVAISLGASAIRIDWTAVGDDGTTGTAAAYDLRYATGATCPLTSANFASGTKATVSAPQPAGSFESVTVSGLATGQTFCFLLKVSDGAGNSAFSNGASAATADVTPPAAAVLSAGTPTETSVLLSWSEPGDDGSVGTATTQELRYLPSASCPLTTANFATGTLVTTPAPQIAGTAQSATATGLARDTSYCFALLVGDEANNRTLSNVVSVHTADLTAPAQAVLAVDTSVAATETSVRIKWDDVGDDGHTDGSPVTQKLFWGAGAASCAGFTTAGAANNATVATAGVNGTHDGFTVSTGLARDTDYCFALVVTDNAGNSSTSAALPFHTPDSTAPAAAVIAVDTTVAASETSVRIKWTDVGDDGSTGTATSQTIYWAAGASNCAGFSTGTATSATVAVAGAAGTADGTTVASGLSRDANFCFQLKVTDNAGNSSLSNVLAYHSPDLTPPAQAVLGTDQQNVATPETQIDITWLDVGDDGNTGTATSQKLYWGPGAANCAGFTVAGAPNNVSVNVAGPAGSGDKQLVSGLTRDTDYCFLLVVTDNAGNSSTSAALAFHTPDLTAPASPAIAVDTITEHSAHFTWLDVGDDGTTGTVASQTLYYGPGASNCAGFNAGNAPSHVTVTPAGAGGTADATTVTGLTSDTNYCFVLKVADNANNTANSNTLSVATPDLTAPAAPTLGHDFNNADDHETQVRITWLDTGDDGNTGTLTSQTIYWAAGLPDCSTFSTSTAQSLSVSVKGPAGSGDFQVISGLTRDTDYCFAVKEVDNVGLSATSAPLAYHTPDLTAPGTPVLGHDSAGVTAADTQVHVTWLDVGDDGSSDGSPVAQTLFYGAGAAGCAGFNPSGQASVTLPSATHAGTADGALVTGLTADTDYCFVLKVVDNASNSASSAALSVHTADLVAPAAPGSFAALVNGSVVTLTWNAPGDNGNDSGTTAASYSLQYVSVASNASCPSAPFSSPTTLTSPGSLPAPAVQGTAQQVILQTLNANTKYCFALQALDEVPNAGAFAQTSATTAGADVTPPAAIADLHATLGTANEAKLTWTAPVQDQGNASSGKVDHYVVRFTTAAAGQACSLDDNSFGGATLLAQSLSPADPGATETLTATIDQQSDPGTGRICFAVQSFDAAGNPSAISNVAAEPERPTLNGATPADDFTLALDFTDGEAGGTEVDVAYYAVRGSSGACPTEALDLIAGGAQSATVVLGSASISQLTPGTHYCVAVASTGGTGSPFQGNAALSAVVDAQTTDHVAPNQITDLAATQHVRKLDLTWSAAGDNDTQGAAAAYKIAYQSGDTCSSTVTTVDVTGLASPPPAHGTPVAFTLTGLAQNTNYCLAVIALDAAGNSTASTPIQVRTLADTIAPPALALQALSPGDVDSANARIHFTAVADTDADGTVGAVTSYVYKVNPTSAGNTTCNGATDFSSPLALAKTPAAPGTPETVQLAIADAQQPACVALAAVDAAGNTGSASNFLYVRDNTAPATPADFAASNVTSSGATLAFTAVGDDGSTGTATSYSLRFLTGANCPITAGNFAAGAAVTVSAPKASGQAESFALTNLDFSTSYCFGLEVLDDAGNASGLATASFGTAAPSATPNAQLAAVRTAIAAATSSAPITLSSLPVQGAVVTYVKPAIGGAAVGTSDGAGFTVQNGANNAVFVALDPTTFVPGGLAVGDAVNFVATKGQWLACATCSATTAGLLSVTQIAAGSAVRHSTGNALPALFDAGAATLVSLPAPIAGTKNWANEALLSKATGIVAAPLFSIGGGISKAQITTAGVASGTNNLMVRLPDAVISALGIVQGSGVSLLSVPLWRTDTEVDLAAWSTADLLASPGVVSMTPAEGATGVSASTTQIVATLNQAVDQTTLTTQSAAGACSGSVQVSTDNASAACVAISAALDGTHTQLTITLTAGVSPGTRYKVRLTSALKSLNASAPSGSWTSPNGFVIAPPGSCTARNVVISQVYGGGGNAFAQFKNDFVELHNRGSVAVDMTGWSIQYASSTGSFSAGNTTVLSATTCTGGHNGQNAKCVIPGGGYFLVQLAASTNGVGLTDPDATGTTNMSATIGKVALVSNGTPLTVACPPLGQAGLLDLVSWGTTTSCATNATPGLQNYLAAQRVDSGCTDTAANNPDFVVVAPAPRNVANAAAACTSCGGVNATGTGVNGGELGYCVIQYPNPVNGYTGTYPITAAVGTPVPNLAQTGVNFVYGQFFQSGVTPSGGGNPAVRAQVGVGPAAADPTTAYVYYPAQYNSAHTGDNNDEWQQSFAAPGPAGSYNVLWRFSVDSGAHWTYCDQHGNGANGGLAAFSTTDLLQLTTQ